jgi:hypothetical protein
MSTTALPTSLIAELDNGPGSPLGLRSDAVKLGARLNQLSKLKSGVATIADGDASVAVDVGAAFDGYPVQLTFAGSPGSAAKAYYEWDGAGELTITVDTDPGADADVAWFVDARTTTDLA